MKQTKFRVWSQEENKFLSINVDNYQLIYQGDIWMLKRSCSTIEESISSTRIIPIDKMGNLNDQIFNLLSEVMASDVEQYSKFVDVYEKMASSESKLNIFYQTLKRFVQNLNKSAVQ